MVAHNPHGELTYRITQALAHLDETLMAFQKALRASKDQLAGYSLDNDACISLERCLTTDHPQGGLLISSLIDAYGQLDYPEDAKDGRESWDMPGVLVAPALLFTLVQEVNKAKDAFQEAVMSANHVFVTEKGIPVDNPGKRRVTWHRSGLSYAEGLLPEGVYPLARWHLAHIGRGNLNFRQCWRNIQTMDVTSLNENQGFDSQIDDPHEDTTYRMPDSLSFSWLHKRNVSRITCRDIKAKVRSIETDHPDVMAMKHTIEQVPSNEVLAYVQHPSPTLVVTGMWKGSELPNNTGRKAHKRMRIQRVANIPLLVCRPHDVAVDVPELLVKAPKNSPEKSQAQTRLKGRKLEDEPLLPVFSVYRYLPEHRHMDDAQNG